ncbi:MAG: ABC transporter substrate-binding protein [Goleter apudmare HA4340-LM2]|jgi:branched-chain amino acid transport system substrate-binding protein|nr:ABC transporter substrate-binding protein [Goleter apudmare HA4340-LM2]
MAHSSPQPPQNVAVMLEIIGGSFDEGFPVTLRILEDGRTIKEDDEDDGLAPLPPASEMPQLYEEWQSISLNGSRKLQAVPAQILNVAESEKWKEATQKLEDYCRTWFQYQAFRSLRDRILAETPVINDRSVSVIIKCPKKHKLLHRIPWHVWDLFFRLPNAELALFSKFAQQVPTLRLPVRILAIFGSSQISGSSEEELDFEKDKQALEFLQQRGGEITLISEPGEKQLSDLLSNHNWDILFFAGHSSSEGQSGYIQISKDVCLPLNALRENLTTAVRRGLKLAIFNSCDGLGIGNFLVSLGLLNLIVMREPVPDIIAREFLIKFLELFSQGTPLFLAVRQARSRLEYLEFRDFPAASWLPVVCINPSQAELVWPEPIPPLESVDSTRTTPTPPPRASLSRPRLMMGFAALAGIVAVATLMMINRCQILPSICLPEAPIDDLNIIAEKNISVGDRPITDSIVKLSEPYLSFKQQGIATFSQGKYESAVVIFEQIRKLAQQHKGIPVLKKAAFAALKDPEILIYKNNALVKQRRSQNPNLPVYTIAVAAPLNLNAGLDILFGVAQAQDVAVNEGINLQVMIANDNNNIDQTKRVAKILFENTNVLAVVGHYTSPNTCAALKVYSNQPNPLVVISPTSSLVNLQSSANCGDPHKVFFRTVSSSRVEAQSLVKYLVEVLNKPQPKVVAFYNGKESFSTDLLDQFVLVLQAFQGSIIAKFDLSDPNFNISQLPPEVRNADALAVLADGGTGNTKAFEKSIEIIKLNQGKKPVLGANPLYLQEVIDQAKNATVNSLFLAVDWHPQQCDAKDFAKQVNDYWGGDLNRRTSLAYEAVQAVLQAIKLSNSPMTRQDIHQKLYDTGIIEGVAASSAASKGVLISFDSRGDRREITTRNIVTVNQQLKFDLVKDYSCPNPK